MMTSMSSPYTKLVSLAFAAILFLPFGGRILMYEPCMNIPGGVGIIVGPPRPGTYIFVPGISQLFMHLLLLPPRWALGIAAPTTSLCATQIVNGIITQSISGGTIIKVGVSGL